MSFANRPLRACPPPSRFDRSRRRSRIARRRRDMIIDAYAVGILGSALITSLALTPVVRAAARRRGLVNRPRADRWAKKPTALYGGVAIFGATVVASFPLLSELEHGWLVLAASTFL